MLLDMASIYQQRTGAHTDGEQRLSHGCHPKSRIGQLAEIRIQIIVQAVYNTRCRCHRNNKSDNKQNKQGRNHDIADFFNSFANTFDTGVKKNTQQHYIKDNAQWFIPSQAVINLIRGHPVPDGCATTHCKINNG